MLSGAEAKSLYEGLTANMKSSGSFCSILLIFLFVFKVYFSFWSEQSQLSSDCEYCVVYTHLHYLNVHFHSIFSDWEWNTDAGVSVSLEFWFCEYICL